MLVINPYSGTTLDHGVAGTDSKLGLILRALFENGKSV